MGVGVTSAVASSPKWMAVMMERVYRSLMRLPTPYLHPQEMASVDSGCGGKTPLALVKIFDNKVGLELQIMSSPRYFL